MAPKKLILDYVYEKESAFADRVYLTQPVGGGKVIDYTWRQALDEARRMAHYVCRNAGGCGAVREVVDLVLKAQGRWDAMIGKYSA